jgi:hypothetical protein
MGWTHDTDTQIGVWYSDQVSGQSGARRQMIVDDHIRL